MTCSVDDCLRPAERNGLCAAHRKRAQRGVTVAGELRDVSRAPHEVLADAALRYADADSTDDREFARAQNNLGQAAKAYARALRPRPGPKPTVSPDVAVAAVTTHGSTRKAAAALGVSPWAVWRAIRRSVASSIRNRQARRCV